jgi:hypothetical protein
LTVGHIGGSRTRETPPDEAVCWWGVGTRGVTWPHPFDSGHRHSTEIRRCRDRTRCSVCGREGRDATGGGGMCAGWSPPARDEPNHPLHARSRRVPPAMDTEDVMDAPTVTVRIGFMWQVADEHHQTDPEALTLWGRLPRPEVVCDECGDVAEPYLCGTCWLCCHARKDVK